MGYHRRRRLLLRRAALRFRQGRRRFVEQSKNDLLRRVSTNNQFGTPLSARAGKHGREVARGQREGAQRGQQGRAWGGGSRGGTKAKEASRNALASLQAKPREKGNREPTLPLRAPLCPVGGTNAAALGGTAFPWPFSCRPREKPRSRFRGRARERERRNIKTRP